MSRLSILILAGLLSVGSALAQFSRSTIDFGVVVSDVEKSLAFYKDVVGFQANGDFTVTPGIAKGAGLSDGTATLKIYKLRLNDEGTATNLKLMQIADAKQKKQDLTYIHSTLGMSYMTIMVSDMDAAIARAAAKGHKPIAQGPYELGEIGADGIYLAILRDPDGNFVELVGPKAK
jgi:predicted enzyme related to lactoylglutathione lyase